MQKRFGGRSVGAVLVLLAVSLTPAFSQTAAPADSGGSKNASADEVALLKQQIALQQKQIEQLQSAMTDMKHRMDGTAAAPAAASASRPLVPPHSKGCERGAVAGPGQHGPSGQPDAHRPSDAEGFIGPVAGTYSRGDGPKGYSRRREPAFGEHWRCAVHAPGLHGLHRLGTINRCGQRHWYLVRRHPIFQLGAGSLSETRFTMQNSRVGVAITSKYWAST